MWTKNGNSSAGSDQASVSSFSCARAVPAAASATTTSAGIDRRHEIAISCSPLAWASAHLCGLPRAAPAGRCVFRRSRRLGRAPAAPVNAYRRPFVARRDSTGAPCRRAAAKAAAAAPCGAPTSASPEPVMPRAGGGSKRDLVDRRAERREAGEELAVARRRQQRIPDEDGRLGPFRDQMAHEGGGGGVLALHLVGGVDQHQPAARRRGASARTPSKPSRRCTAVPGHGRASRRAPHARPGAARRASAGPAARSSVRARSGEPG